MSGDTFNQTHSGSGNNVINVGRQEFRLTPEILEEVLRRPNGLESVEIWSIGGQKSFLMAQEIAHFLNANNKPAAVTARVGMMAPPPEGPLTMQLPNRLLIDASK